MFLFFLVSIALLVVLFFLFRFFSQDILVSGYSRRDLKPEEHRRLYQTRTSILNKSEQALFFELRKQLPNNYHVFANMRIADIINASNGSGFYNRRNKILPKHVDFLICDFNFKPVVAIELNGSSHDRHDRIERDELVRNIFSDAGMPLVFINVGSDFSGAVSDTIKTLGIK